MPAKRGAAANDDPKVQPAYTLAEAAHTLRLSTGTLRSWVLGRRYPTAGGERTFPPIVRPAQGEPTLLSFWNLVEAHVVRALRTEHGVPVPSLRKAIAYAEKELGIDKLLLRRDLQTDAGRLFLEHYGKLIDLSSSGQLAMQTVLQAHLRRVEWNDDAMPIRLYPFLTADTVGDARPIAIDPVVQFGRPVVQRVGVSTRAIADRLDAGETVEDLAADYGVDCNRDRAGRALRTRGLSPAFFTDRDLGKQFRISCAAPVSSCIAMAICSRRTRQTMSGSSGLVARDGPQSRTMDASATNRMNFRP